MEGFVGTRAKRRRRNVFVFLFFIILSTLIYIFLPSISINNYEISPESSLLPEPDESISSLYSSIEELNLVIFQKDQKIKFRSDEINSLKNKIISINRDYNILNSKYKSLEENKLEKSNTKSNNLYSLNKEIKELKNINKKNDILIKDLKKQIKLIDENNSNNNIIIEKFKNENESLKKEIKSILQKNIKLFNLKKDLELRIEIQNQEIEMLKDTTHHNR